MQSPGSSYHIKCRVSICPPETNSACRRTCDTIPRSRRSSSSSPSSHDKVLEISRVIRVERPDLRCTDLPPAQHLAHVVCSNGTHAHSTCEFTCESGFFNAGSKKRKCQIGFDSPGFGVYYGVQPKWIPDLPPKCVGEREIDFFFFCPCT